MSLKDFIKPKIRSLLKHSAIIKILSFFIFMYAKLIGVTTKWKYIGIKTFNATEKSGAIWIGWHSRAVLLPYFWQKFCSRKLYALVSPHQDGQLIANFLRFYNISPVSGSTNERSAQSALEIMHLLDNKENICITPDGPRGPRMRMKKSPIYFASKTGLPIVCVGVSVSKSHIIEKAWDKTMIPFPFGNGVFILSEPIYIPTDIDEEQTEEYRQKVEKIANELSFSCDTQAGISPVEPAELTDIKKKRF